MDRSEGFNQRLSLNQTERIDEMESFKDFIKEMDAKKKQEKKKEEGGDGKATVDKRQPFQVQPAAVIPND